MAAGLVLVAAVPARALDVGERMSFDHAVEQLKKDNWVPLVAGSVLLSSDAPAAEEGTIESEIKPTASMLMIFNQKGTDKWSVGSRSGDNFVIWAEGHSLNLSPLEDKDTVSVSYKPNIIPVQQAAQGSRCGPADKVDLSMRKKDHLAAVIEGVELDGAAKVSFYAAHDNSRKWAVIRTTPDSISCVMAAGTGYILNAERQEFVPVWKQNMLNPS